MYALVFFQLFLFREVLRTFVTLKRFVAGVNASVKFQFLFTGKALAANIAQGGIVSAVHVMFASLVAFQSRGRRVVFVAYGTIVLNQRHSGHYFEMLRSSMRRQEPGKHERLPAYLAYERFLAGMKIFVFYRARTYRKRFVANFALVFRFAFVRLNVQLEMVLRRRSVFAGVARISLVVVVYYRMQTVP